MNRYTYLIVLTACILFVTPPVQAQPCNCPGVIGGICECGPTCGCAVFVQAVPPDKLPAYSWGKAYADYDGTPVLPCYCGEVACGGYKVSTGVYVTVVNGKWGKVETPPIPLPVMTPRPNVAQSAVYSDVTGSYASGSCSSASGCSNGQCGSSVTGARVGLFGRRRGG